MDLEALREHCLAKPAATESFPFDEVTLVFKVAGKMFALLSLDEVPQSLSLKCEPVHAMELRDKYTGITPGYHLSKKHWNSLVLDGSLPTALVYQLVEESYSLVVAGLPKATRATLASS